MPSWSMNRSIISKFQSPGGCDDCKQIRSRAQRNQAANHEHTEDCFATTVEDCVAADAGEREGLHQSPRCACESSALLHQRSRRRGDGHRVERSRHDGARPPGDLGRFARRLPANATVQWWNWHDSYMPGAAPDPKWVEVSDAGEAAFREPRSNTL